MKRRDRNLIVFLNRRCHVGCQSCNVLATPNKNRELAPQWLDLFFTKIQNIEFSQYVIWTGGEPFLSFQSLKEGIYQAHKNGYHSEILTSGYWFSEHPEILEDLFLRGSFSLRISLDYEHQKKVPISTILCLIGKALELGIEVNFTVREIPGYPSPLSSILEKIKNCYPHYYRQNVIRSRWIHFIPHITVKLRDNRMIKRKLKTLKKANQKQICNMGFKDLVIGEDGQLYPCCGLFSIPGFNRLAYGRPVKEGWDIIEKRQSTNSLFNALRERGPYELYLDLACRDKKPDWLNGFTSPCQICILLFHDYRKKVFKKLQEDAEITKRVII